MAGSLGLNGGGAAAAVPTVAVLLYDLDLDLVTF